MSVSPKKHLGQHFLTDENIAQNIVDSLSLEGITDVLEIGPGMGVLTKYLIQKNIRLHLIEIDRESIAYLILHFKQLEEPILSEDFLQFDLSTYFKNRTVAIIGNFPYNISSQIIFKMLENKELVKELCGMFQKEVALRITAEPGSKIYGILSVLTQAFYEATYLFSVAPTVFNPPPKVDSGVIRLVRKENFVLPVDKDLFTKIVKTGFNQRRKTLRNSLKTLNLSDKLKEDPIFAQRPEQLSVDQFLVLTEKISNDAI